jgi:hypothetical protein
LTNGRRVKHISDCNKRKGQFLRLKKVVVHDIHLLFISISLKCCASENSSYLLLGYNKNEEKKEKLENYETIYTFYYEKPRDWQCVCAQQSSSIEQFWFNMFNNQAFFFHLTAYETYVGKRARNK